MEIKQGDIIKVNLNPKKGHEQQGYRPCICLSNEMVYNYGNIIIVAPISNTERQYPFYISLQDTQTTGKILLDQIGAIDPNAREAKVIERVNDNFLREVLHYSKLLFDENIE